MSRTSKVVVFGALGLLAFPATAAAQFTPAYVMPNPLYMHPAYRYQFSMGTTIQTSYGPAYIGVTSPFTSAPQLFSPNYGMGYGGGYAWSPGGVASSGYLSGGSYSGSSYGSRHYDSAAAQRDFEKAQKEATWARNNPDAVKKMIADQGAYEKAGVSVLPAGVAPGAVPDAFLKALSATDESDVASGEVLNQVLAAVAIAEAKGGKGPSAFLPPQLLDDVRFSGGLGDLLNLVRQSGRLQFPAAFAGPELRDLRDALDRDLTAAAAPLLAGKPLDPMKVMKLEATFKRLEDAAAPVVRNLSFEDAIAARRFLNQFANAVRAMKGTGLTGVVNPNWATEGANAGDLAKHMTKYKLQFAPAPRGGEPAYLALHRALVTYLFTLNPPKK
jgi:hypothetical protein